MRNAFLIAVVVEIAIVSGILVANHFLGGVIPINVYSEDPHIRMEQLLYASEDLNDIRDEWRRIWFTDQPSHLTPQRVHGGITP